MTETHKPGTGAIFGIVTEEGVAKDASPVYLYDTRRWEGAGKKKLLARRFTRPDGGFEFAGLNTNYGDYMVMVTDEDGAEPKNALVQDRVTPIPAHAGSGQLSEWYTRAMRDGAQAGFLAWPVIQDGLNAPAPRGLISRPAQNETHPISWPPNPDAPPEIPNMAVVEFNPLGYGPYAVGRRVSNTEDTAASLELLVDLTSIATQAGVCITGGFHVCSWTTAASYLASFASLSTDTATTGSSSANRDRTAQAKLILALEPNKTVTAYLSSTTSGTRQTWVLNLTNLGSVDLSAYSGTIHLVASFTPASDIKFFVNTFKRSHKYTFKFY